MECARKEAVGQQKDRASRVEKSGKIYKTFHELGLRTEKSIATHILLENAFESNLLSDISKVDYLANNKGRTHLRPLEGLSTFVDDVYVFGYMRKEDGISYRGRYSCAPSSMGTQDVGAAKQILRKISCAVSETFSNYHNKPIQPSIIHTIEKRHRECGGTIQTTIEEIENQTNCAAKKKWLERYPEEKKPTGLFVAKLDVSELDIDLLHSRIPILDSFLQSYGYGIYSIDYTRDFSGVLDREELVQYLCDTLYFRYQGKTTFGRFQTIDAPTILENTVGKHVCTWVERKDGYTTRTKLYNKVVSNFEAGEVRATMGAHLAEYVDCPNEHLRKTFFHPDVQERGCTRVEVSIYACNREYLSSKTADSIVGEVFDLVSPPDRELFVVQPPKMQYRNLSAKIDRCMVVADKPQGTIYVGWYAHTKTGRIAGVCVRPTKAKVDNPKQWERAIEWSIGDFGFRNCPIFRVDILAIEEKEIVLGPLRCYAKDGNAKTILTATKRPTQLHMDADDPSLYLPPTKYVEWEWRKSKSQAIGRGTPAYRVEETPAIAEKRQIATNSTKTREKRLQEIEDATLALEWKMSMEKQIAKEKEYLALENEKRKKELESIARIVAIQRERKERIQESYAIFEEAFQYRNVVSCKTIPPNQKWEVLGFRRTYSESMEKTISRVLLQSSEGLDENIVWGTKMIEKILDICIAAFQIKEYRNGKKDYWLEDPENSKLVLHIEGEKTFYTPEGKQIGWNPVLVCETPNPTMLVDAQEMEKNEALYAEIERQTTFPKLLQAKECPKPKDCTTTLEMGAGDYICCKFAQTTYRGSKRTVLFLQQLDKEGNVISGEETPAYGVFLQKEVEKMDLEHGQDAIRCNLGAVRTTPNKRKDRIAILAK